MVRLIVIALMITYFIGCIFYYISNEIAAGNSKISSDEMAKLQAKLEHADGN